MSDWEFLKLDRVMTGIEFFAKAWGSRFGSVDDARQEAIAYIAEHPAVVGEDHIGSGMIYLRLAQRVGKRAVKPVDDVHVTEVGDAAVSVSEGLTEASTGAYAVDGVARLVAVCFQGVEFLDSLRDPFGERVVPEVYRKVYSDPSHANTLWAEVADIRSAYLFGVCNRVGLSPSEERSLLLKYVMDLPDKVVRSYGGSEYQAKNAVVKIVNFLNDGKVGV